MDYTVQIGLSILDFVETPLSKNAVSYFPSGSWLEAGFSQKKTW